MPGNNLSPLNTGLSVPPADVWWTPWPKTGPGTELLGTVQNRNVLELGCGSGRNAAALAAVGARVVAIDLSREAVQRAHDRWGHIPRLRFVHTDAATYLRQSDRPADIILSVFGALTFTPADTLLPIIGTRLSPTGQLAVALRSRGSDQQGDIGYRYTGRQWASSLRALGLHMTRCLEIHAPSLDSPSCLVTVGALGRRPVR